MAYGADLAASGVRQTVTGNETTTQTNRAIASLAGQKAADSFELALAAATAGSALSRPPFLARGTTPVPAATGTIRLLTTEQLCEVCAGTKSPALADSPYSAESVAERVRPSYRSNPALDPRSPAFNPTKTVEPPDAASVYQDATRANTWTWFGQGAEGWYRFFSDNAGGVHFSGTVSESLVPANILRGK